MYKNKMRTVFINSWSYSTADMQCTHDENYTSFAFSLLVHKMERGEGRVLIQGNGALWGRLFDELTNSKNS